MNDGCKLLRAQSSTADPANGMTGQSCKAKCAPDSDVDSFYLSDMFVSGNSLNGYSALKDAADFVEEVDDTDFGRDVHNFENYFQEAVTMQAANSSLRVWKTRQVPRNPRRTQADEIT
jgi:hypothetical protein